MWIPVNPNSCGKYVGDCTIRALSMLLDQEWDQTYVELCITGFEICDMPSSNAVWGLYLQRHGFECEPLSFSSKSKVKEVQYQSDGCRILMATGTHVVTAIDGDYYDTWDSGEEQVIAIWKEKT